MEKYYIHEKYVDLVECNISRKKSLCAPDVRPSNCCAIAYVALSQKTWRALIYMHLKDSHRRVDEVVTVGELQNEPFALLFADELVRGWIFSARSSARI